MQFWHLVLKRIYKSIAKRWICHNLKSGKAIKLSIKKRNPVMFAITFCISSLLIGVIAGLVIAGRIESNPHFS